VCFRLAKRSLGRLPCSAVWDAQLVYKIRFRIDWNWHHYIAGQELSRLQTPVEWLASTPAIFNSRRTTQLYLMIVLIFSLVPPSLEGAPGEGLYYHFPSATFVLGRIQGGWILIPIFILTLSTAGTRMLNVMSCRFKSVRPWILFRGSSFFRASSKDT
jgi:hypothetical protein